MGLILEAILTYVFDVLVYIVSYNTGKILILIFTFGKYSSESISSVKRTWKKKSVPVTSAEENKKCISFNYTCTIGFLFWVVLVTIFIIVK